MVTNNTEILKSYKEFLVESKKAKNTVESYYSIVNRAINEISKDISQITQEDINQYFEEKKSAHKISTLRILKSSLCDFLMFIESDIKINTKLPRAKFEAQAIPSESDFKKIVFYAGTKPGYEGIRNQTILSVLYHAGLRIDETRILQIDDIDLDERKIYVFGKGSKRRFVPINDTLYESLVKYLKVRFMFQGSDYLFLSAGKNNHGDVLSYGSFRQLVKSLCKAAGYSNLSPYSFRHSFCTKLIRSGASFSVIACLMGHSDTTSLIAYYVPENLDGRDAVKALNF